MKLPLRAVRRKARIEIIPLIDIMFFLLACFMMVSLQMIQMRGIKINLPTAQASTQEKKNDFVTVTVDPAGEYYLEKEKLDATGLRVAIQKLHAENKDVKVYVRGDRDALHGEVISALDQIRAAGVQKVAFEIKATAESATPPANPAPGNATPPTSEAPSTATAAPATAPAVPSTASVTPSAPLENTPSTAQP